MGDYTVTVTVGGVVRGNEPQPSLVFQPAECACTWSWGLQPATALIDWVSAAPLREVLDPQAPMTVLPKALLTIETKGHLFYGICNSAVATQGSDGSSLMQEFRDSREILDWETMYGAFNIRDHRIVNGQWVRRYKHILPANFRTRLWTYTVAAYTAREILDFVFGVSTVPWLRSYHYALNYPVFEVDWTQGRKLGQCLLEISNRVGLTFTLMGGRWTLVWCMKGVDGAGNPMALPDFPPNSDNRRRGSALSGNPSAVRILGDRNEYQVLNIPMQPDWVSGWEPFYDFNSFVRDIFLNEKTELDIAGVVAGTLYTDIDQDNDNNAGFMLARARAQVMTVGQYAALRDARDNNGNAFRDYRRFQNQSRLQMPVALYLSQVLWKAFRFPNGFTFRNRNGDYVGLQSVDVLEKSLVQVTHDPGNGSMFADVILPSQPNGYAIAQGYQVGSDGFKSLHPEYFDINNWLGQQSVWQSLPFHVDNSGEGDQFICFEDPVINSADIIQMVNGYGVLNGGGTLTAAPVKVALTFAAENFNCLFGLNDVKEAVENVSGLHGEHVSLGANWDPQEISYADGQTAARKASAVAAPLLNRQFWYDYGGWTVQGSNGTLLSPVIDRVTVRLSAGGGLTEEVDLTNQRSHNISVVYTPGPGGRMHATTLMQREPERDFERRSQLAPLMPGQAELRDQANQLRTEAALLIKNPRLSRMLMDSFHLLMGLDVVPETVMLQAGSGGTSGVGTSVPSAAAPLAVGTPMWRESSKHNPWLPKDTSPTQLTKPVFMGVTTVNSEPPQGPVRLTRTGNNGEVYVRVKGAVQNKDGVGISSGKEAKSYLEKSGEAIYTVLDAIPDTSVRLIRARVASGGNGSGWFRIKSVQDDYLTCRTWDGTNEGSTDLYVAKAWKLRQSISSELKVGDPYDYTYVNSLDANNVVRTSTNRTTGDQEDEVVIPLWLVSGTIYKGAPAADLICATNLSVPDVTGGDGQSCSWVMDQDERKWAALTPDSDTGVAPAVPFVLDVPGTPLNGTSDVSGSSGTSSMGGGTNGSTGYPYCLTSDGTSTQSSGNLTNLSVVMPATSGTYLLDFQVLAACSSTSGIKYAITAPPGATVEGWVYSSGPSPSAPIGQRLTAPGTWTSTPIHTVADSPAGDIIRARVQLNGTGGTIGLSFAPVEASGDVATVYAGSWMYLVVGILV